MAVLAQNVVIPDINGIKDLIFGVLLLLCHC